MRQRTPRKLQLIPCSYGFGGGRKAPQEIGEEPDGFLTVKDQAKSKEFYVGILGGKVIRPENPCYIKLENSWIILNSGGGPTPDKPEVILETLQDLNRVSSFLNLRVADIRGCYKKWRAKGAQFPTEPLDNHGHEWRCYMRDPDGYLIEVGQYTETSIRHFKEFSARE